MMGQYFLEFHTAYDDSYREWEIFLEQDSIEIEGSLTVSWGLNNDYSEWQYRVEDLYGEISQKFANNPGHWELRSDGNIVTIQQVWPGDPTEWKISNGKRRFTIQSLHRNRVDEWAVIEREYGELVVYTERLGDGRDWVISDYMIDEVTFEERMAAIFIAIFTSTPKR